MPFSSSMGKLATHVSNSSAVTSWPSLLVPSTTLSCTISPGHQVLWHVAPLSLGCGPAGLARCGNSRAAQPAQSLSDGFHRRPFLIGFRTCCRSEEHTSELQSLRHLVCRLLLEKTTHSLHERALPCLATSVSQPSCGGSFC